MFFRKNPDTSLNIDLHSHLLPGIDDGVKTMDAAIEAIQGLIGLGFNGCVTTPHFYQEVYPNQEEKVLELGKALQEELVNRSIAFQVIAAGEYFIDTFLLEKVKSGKKLNSFGQNYVLVETSFLEKPQIFEEVIFELRSCGYRPVLAHPERYQYLFNQSELAIEWTEQGLLLQITTGSLSGMYGKGPEKLAQRLIDAKTIHFVGSDLHTHKHLPAMQAGMSSKHYKRALKLPLLNDTLI